MGITLCAAAMNMGMLIIGRICIGLGVGLGNQVGHHGVLKGSPSFKCSCASGMPSRAPVIIMLYESRIACTWLTLQHMHTQDALECCVAPLLLRKGHTGRHSCTLDAFLVA